MQHSYPILLARAVDDDVLEAGCDEAGRGCLAGNVFAAAVILDAKNPIDGLNDSKKLTEKQREMLRREIEEKAIAFGIGTASAEEIDHINILRASILAMHRALDALAIHPQRILVDGNRFSPYKGVPYRCCVKGDARFQSIAAASILAKTYRDSYMRELHAKYPQYNWIKNKAYPTREHFEAIRCHGLSPYHRKSFARSRVENQLFPSIED